jgi:hypothetical protein
MKKFYLILKILILTILVSAGAYFIWLFQEVREVSMCGFQIAQGESVISIRNGTVAQSGDISIGASVGPNNSFILTFFNGIEQKKFSVKECDTFEYKSRLDTLSVKVSKIRPNINWWSKASGSNTASVELIILHIVASDVSN